MNIIAGIVVLILFIIALIMFWYIVQKNEKPFGMAMWLFLQMLIDFIVALYLLKI